MDVPTYSWILLLAGLAIFEGEIAFIQLRPVLHQKALTWHLASTECVCGLFSPYQSSLEIFLNLAFQKNRFQAWINLKWITGVENFEKNNDMKPTLSGKVTHNACIYFYEGQLYASDCWMKKGVVCQKYTEDKKWCLNTSSSLEAATETCNDQQAHLHAPLADSFVIPDNCKNQGHSGFWTEARFINHSYTNENLHGLEEIDVEQYNCSRSSVMDAYVLCGLIQIESGRVFCSYVSCDEKHSYFCNSCPSDDISRSMEKATMGNTEADGKNTGEIISLYWILGFVLLFLVALIISAILIGKKYKRHPQNPRVAVNIGAIDSTAGSLKEVTFRGMESISPAIETEERKQILETQPTFQNIPKATSVYQEIHEADYHEISEEQQMPPAMLESLSEYHHTCMPREQLGMESAAEDQSGYMRMGPITNYANCPRTSDGYEVAACHGHVAYDDTFDTAS